MELRLPSSPLLLLTISLLLLAAVYKRVTRKPTAFDTQPWGGLPSGRFGRLRAMFSFGGAQEGMARAYKEYSEKGQTFIWQPILTRPIIVVPPNQIPWMMEQPDSVLSALEFFKERQLGRGMLSNDILHDPLHEKVIRSDLTRALSWNTEFVADEVRASLHDYVGDSAEWHNFGMWDCMTKTFARTSARIFVGLPLCRDETFIEHVINYAGAALSSGPFLQAFPELLRPLVGLAVLYPNRKHYRRTAQYVIPLIEQRRADMERAACDPDFKYQEPNDLLQWTLVSSLRSDRSFNWNNDLICKRYLACTVAAIHTTAVMSSHILFDLASSPPELRATETLREEVLQVRAELSGGEWTRAALAKLVRLDSAIRESMRMGQMSGIGSGRVVTAPGGVTLEDGAYAPKGSHLCVHAFGVHQFDPSYAEPQKYDPFRFSRPREAFEARGDDKGVNGAAREETAAEKGTAYLQQRSTTAATTSPSFLSFGHGRHACPGRFFAIAELKLMLVEFLVRYDIKPIEQRPANMWIREIQIPDVKAELTVRRRTSES